MFGPVESMGELSRIGAGDGDGILGSGGIMFNCGVSVVTGGMGAGI